MGTTYRFLADPAGPREVLAWFRQLPIPPVEKPTDRYMAFWFRDLGPLVDEREGGPVDTDRSPVVTLYEPRVRRGVLFTVGEVHFLPTPLRPQFPELHEVSAKLRSWLEERPCVFSNRRDFEGEWGERMMGSIANYDPPVHAFPSGLQALEGGRYFVSDDESDPVLDRVCAVLRLRGIECESGPPDREA
jgi:hypothetical protein